MSNSPSFSKPVRKKVAVVTGANRGLGLEVARQLACEHDFHVVVTARSLDAAREACSQLAAEGASVQPAALDVTDANSITALIEQLQPQEGGITALINNAGIFPGRGSALTAPAAELEDAFRTNTLGVFNVTQAFVPLLRKSGHGRVVMVSSGMGQLSEMGDGAVGYRVSKTALNALTRIFAAELESDGIKVNAACPGWVRTDMGGNLAPRTLPEGAASLTWGALLDDSGPTGGFFRDGKSIDW